MNLHDYIRRKRSVLFVASGPCKSELDVWRPHFDTVAAHQQTCLDVSGDIDYGIFVDHEPTATALPAFPRIKYFIVPNVIASNVDVNDTRTHEQCGIPADRVLEFPRHLQGVDRGGANHIIKETDEIFWCYSGTPHGIQVLAMLGFQWIFCLGFSDLQGKVEGFYVEAMRTACEYVADAVAERYGSRVVFWTPDMTPENWRANCRRGFVMTRTEGDFNSSKYDETAMVLN